ncbi:MAG: reverse transcriptase-like protein [Rhodospirillaceae bacterium]|nr:MAG: reverse transcriptase-like protein [Rhodospirillaceae bacterium]
MTNRSAVMLNGDRRRPHQSGLGDALPCLRRQVHLGVARQLGHAGSKRPLGSIGGGSRHDHPVRGGRHLRLFRLGVHRNGVQPMNKPDVTIFADASVDPKTKVAGWASWLKADGQRSVTVSGIVKEPVADVMHAELIAIANGLAVAKSRGLISRHVMLQSDCSAALTAICMVIPRTIERPAPGGHQIDARAKITKRQRKGLKVIAELLAGLEVSVRHVKGHKKGDGRNWVNRQCDGLAKKHMRELRQQVNAGQTGLPGADVVPNGGRDRAPDKEAKHQAQRHGRPHSRGECGNRVEVGIPDQVGDGRISDQIKREQASLRAATLTPGEIRPGNTSADDHQEKHPCRAICRRRHEVIGEVHKRLPDRTLS